MGIILIFEGGLENFGFFNIVWGKDCFFMIDCVGDGGFKEVANQG